ncbi:MAG: OmpA family protein [Crocinitomicaceae bacterium]|nr:OmpA family protein [Flavobacteriales bacterium]NQZ34401.1 OmpA family protein [Crocinitomicaceae bacterium]
MKFISFIFIFLSTTTSFAQNRSICPDVTGSLDHLLLEKYKNSCIVAYDESKFNAVTFPISKLSSNEGAPEEITVEGKVVNIIYGIENSNKATVLEVQRNYEQALKNSDFKILHSAFGKKNIGGYYKLQNVYEIFGDPKVVGQYMHLKPKSYFRFSMSPHNSNTDSDDAYFVAQGKRDGKIYTLALFIHYNRSSWEGLAGNIFVQAQIVEKEDMETGQVSAASIDEKIKNEGKEVFHNILFDFGSDQLTEESYAVLETLSEYLKANKEQAYYIVGHTDNIGSLPTNQVLSEKRAKAVITALTSKYGIAASQISAHGVGQLSPLAINTTEEGRALNRRVEIVLK